MMAGFAGLLGGGTAGSAPAPADPRRDLTVDIVERVMPCVVNIATEEIVEYRDPFADLFREFWGPYYRNRPRDTRYSLGSGVIIDEEGYVMTNLHVVQRARRVWVQLHDGREFEARPIVGTSRRDVALLKLTPKAGEKFQTVRFAKPDDLWLGETVLALGNPFGLGGSVSRGILSSKNRRPPLESEPLEIADWLQTDAAINPGSSGGPLINLRGELIGLNVAVYREGQGIGFAIPAKQVYEGLSEIFTPEVQGQLWFGARLRADPATLQVAEVDPGSPADQAGLKAGDLLVQVGSRTPRNFLHAVELITAADRKAVRLTVQRGGERRDLTVQLLPLGELVRERLGLTLQELTPELAEPLGLRARAGLLIADVEKGGPAAAARLQPGQVLASMGGQATPDLLSATSALLARKPGDRLEVGVLMLQRRGPFNGVVEGRAVLRIR